MGAVRRGMDQNAAPSMRKILSRFCRRAVGFLSRTVIHRRTEIVIETEQVVIVRRRSSRRSWCRECGREVEVVNRSQSGTLAGKKLLAAPVHGRAKVNRVDSPG